MLGRIVLEKHQKICIEPWNGKQDGNAAVKVGTRSRVDATDSLKHLVNFCRPPLLAKHFNHHM